MKMAPIIALPGWFPLIEGIFERRGRSRALGDDAMDGGNAAVVSPWVWLVLNGTQRGRGLRFALHRE